jgi:hypothetical protein
LIFQVSVDELSGETGKEKIAAALEAFINQHSDCEARATANFDLFRSHNDHSSFLQWPAAELIKESLPSARK